MPKSAFKKQRKMARTQKKAAKRQAATRAARRGFQEKPRSQRNRDPQPGVFLPGLLFARSLFETLTSTARKPVKFEAAAYRQAQRSRKAA